MIIVVEGIDGSGKTSVVTALTEQLRATYLPSTRTVEQLAFPYRHSPTGRVIDRYLRCPTQMTGIDAYAHQALQVVNRLEQLQWLADPARLNVLSRYTPSAMVYGGLDGCDADWLAQVTAALPLPDLCVLLTCEPELALSRMRGRGVTSDQYERRGIEWFRAAAQAYDRLWDANDTMRGLDAEGTVWLRLRPDGDDTPARVAAQIKSVFLGTFTCSCGRYHNAARTPCRGHSEVTP